MNRYFILAVLVHALLFVDRSNAAIQFFTTLGTWQSAVGTTDVVEDFQSFTTDRPFTIASGPVALAGGMSIVQVGTSTSLSSRNKIEVLPFELPGNSPNGSTFANMNLSVPANNVRLSFQIPISAWGADFGLARGGAYLTVAAVGPGGELASMVIPTDNSFLGFRATSGESINSVILRGDSGPTNEEDLGMDNARFSFVPEPATMLLMSLGSGPAICRMRKRRIGRPLALEDSTYLTAT
jgi:hypothetical protein